MDNRPEDDDSPPVSTRKFECGDRVEYEGRAFPPFFGRIGTVVGFTSIGFVMVDFDPKDEDRAKHPAASAIRSRRLRLNPRVLKAADVNEAP